MKIGRNNTSNLFFFHQIFLDLKKIQVETEGKSPKYHITRSLTGEKEQWDKTECRKERRKIHLTTHFQLSFENFHLAVKKAFVKLISPKLPKPHLPISSPGFDHLTCQFITVSHILKPNKDTDCHIHFILGEREVRLNVSCESGPSGMSFSQFLQNTSRTA